VEKIVDSFRKRSDLRAFSSLAKLCAILLNDINLYLSVVKCAVKQTNSGESGFWQRSRDLAGFPQSVMKIH